MKIIEATTENFEEAIENELVIVKFFAAWCGPCKMLTPVVEEVINEKNVTLVTVDIDNTVDIATKYAVMSVPTLMLFSKGVLKASHMGFIPKESLIKWIEENKA